MSVDDATLDELLTDAVVYAHDHVGKGGLPFVGVVVTTDGEVSPCGVNQVRATGDPTAHAEIVAMRSLATSHGAVALTGATLLATGEPCALCYRFAAQHGIRRVVYAVDQDAAAVWGFNYRSDPAALTTTEKALRSRPSTGNSKPSSTPPHPNWFSCTVSAPNSPASSSSPQVTTPPASITMNRPGFDAASFLAKDADHAHQVPHRAA